MSKLIYTSKEIQIIQNEIAKTGDSIRLYFQILGGSHRITGPEVADKGIIILKKKRIKALIRIKKELHDAIQRLRKE